MVGSVENLAPWEPIVLSSSSRHFIFQSLAYSPGSFSFHQGLVSNGNRCRCFFYDCRRRSWLSRVWFSSEMCLWQTKGPMRWNIPEASSRTTATFCLHVKYSVPRTCILRLNFWLRKYHCLENKVALVWGSTLFSSLSGKISFCFVSLDLDPSISHDRC